MARCAVPRVNFLAFIHHLLVDRIYFGKWPLRRRQIAQIMIEVGHALKEPRFGRRAETERRID